MNGRKFVVYIRELFQLAGSDIDTAAQKYFADSHEHPIDAFDVGVIATQAAGLRIVAARPKNNMVFGPDARLVLTTLVQSKDNTLQAMDFYVSPNVEDAGCGNFAASLAASSQPGARALDTQGGRVSLPSGGNTIDVDVPAGFVVTSKPGPDFFVHLVRKLAPLGKYPGHLLIYLGGHPDRSVPKGATASSKKAKLNGTPTQFEGFRDDSRASFVATVPASSGGGHLQLQVRLAATLDGSFVDELMPIAETVRVR